MFSRWLILPALLSCFAVAGTDVSQPLLDIDFTQVGTIQHIKKKGTFDGVIPSGIMVDYPHHNESIATGKTMTEDGRRFIRFQVERKDKAVQFQYINIKIPSGYSRLEVECRIPVGWLDLFIRQANAPYIIFWKKSLKASAGWSKQVFNVYLAPQKQQKHIGTLVTADSSNLRLFWTLPEGVTDLASIKLFPATAALQKEIDREAEQAAAAQQASLIRPPQDAPNFLRNSRFPLGLPSGWNVYRGSLPGEFTVATDQTEVGPSGCRPLLIDGTIVYSEPFNTPSAKTGKKCVFSFSYKAKKSFRVTVMAADFVQNGSGPKIRNVAGTALPPVADWQRCDLVFTEPDEHTKSLFLCFSDGEIDWKKTSGVICSPHSNIKLDSLQVYYGEPGRPYCSAGDCEIALAPVASEMAAERVQFADESAKIRYCATGNLKNAVLKIRVGDLYGQSCFLPDVKLSSAPQGELDYAVFPAAPLGQFRIEVWAERDGKRISPYNELVMTRIRRPLYWGKDAPNSPFGTHALPLKARSMKAAGINWVRLHDAGSLMLWATVEPEKGKWNFMDKEIQEYRHSHLKLAGMLSSVPAWAAVCPYKGDRYWDRYHRPKNLDDYANYVRAVVGHYQGVIDEYIIWNEPTWNGSGSDSKYWYKDYAPSVSKADRDADAIRHFSELSKAAYANAKQVDPQVTIIGINAGAQPWMNRLLKSGAYDACDKVDFHYYPNQSGITVFGYPGDPLERKTAEVRRVAKEQGKPLLNTESNPSHLDANVTHDDESSNINDGGGIYRHSLAWKSPTDYLAVANATAAFSMKNLALGVERLFLYSAHCYEMLSRMPTLLVLLNSDGYPAPSYVAFSNLAWLLEDRKFAECVLVGDNVWAYIFAGRDESVAVISGLKTGKYTVPSLRDIEALDLFGNPLPPGAKYEGRLLYLVNSCPAEQFAELLKRK